MKEKIIVALATLKITLLLYILELPNRVNYMPGGEAFLPLLVFLIWLIGHGVKKELEEDRKVGKGPGSVKCYTKFRKEDVNGQEANGRD